MISQGPLRTVVALGRLNRKRLLGGDIAVLIAANLALAMASNAWAVGAGAALRGLHMSATQGILTAMIAETTPDNLRGTVFGMFNLISGIALVAASNIARRMCTWLRPAITFHADAAFFAIALPGMLTTSQCAASPRRLARLIRGIELARAVLRMNSQHRLRDRRDAQGDDDDCGWSSRIWNANF